MFRTCQGYNWETQFVECCLPHMDSTKADFSPTDFHENVIHGLVKHMRASLRSIDISGLSNDDSEQGSLRSLWEASDLSAEEFADEIADYLDCPRIQLRDLLAAPSLADRFSSRFLRERMIFPYHSGGGRVCLAVADPTDMAARRGAQIVLGGELAVAIASFDDIAAVLSERGGAEGGGAESSPPESVSGGADESIDTLRDLASGAPVVRAVNDLLER